MELERFNLQDAPGSWREEEPEEEEEESSRCPWIECSRVHNTVSKWMLPGEARATYLERASCIPPPIFILAISLAELSVFIYYAVWKPQTQWITLEVGIWESPLIYRPEKRKEAWRFLSYMFLHAGVEHIIGNLVLQLCLGIPLELVHKGHRVGAVYLAGVIGGSLASSICDPLLGLVGASGGVYALIGGYFMNILLNFREMIPLFGIARLLFIGLIVGTDVGFALYRRFLSPSTGIQVSFVAHIAGGLAGMSVGYVIFSNFDKNFVKDPRFWICISAFLIFVILAVLFNVFFSPANQ
ncbi:rhomboid-related protein 2 [Notechis scutatus]|uniref:Rhomboid-related protein 2 n=1 Tax=Notechis scutatus TaxID=8663 RepID=A0A6J1ULX5_9SAUR|nr:rhomboid-related protein 2 [Notechis scutatus]